MIRRTWIFLNAIAVTLASLVAAAFTHNENWPLNIPLGLLVGTVFGWVSWPILRIDDKRR